jgi:hypothetical protein
VVQHPVQTTVQPNGHCTTDAVTSTIVVHGIRGGAGASTIAAVLALTGRTMMHTQLVVAEPDNAAALLGMERPVELPVEVTPKLTLATEPAAGAPLTIVDAGTLAAPRCGPTMLGERHLGVLRGPCYLALRSLFDSKQHLDGIVLVRESGRALTERDITDVTDLDVLATVDASPSVARSIDAGLLPSCIGSLAEFRQLRSWLTRQIDPFPTRPTTAPNHPEMTGTDLLLPQSGSSSRRLQNHHWTAVQQHDRAPGQVPEGVAQQRLS